MTQHVLNVFSGDCTRCWKENWEAAQKVTEQDLTPSWDRPQEPA